MTETLFNAINLHPKKPPKNLGTPSIHDDQANLAEIEIYHELELNCIAANGTTRLLISTSLSNTKKCAAKNISIPSLRSFKCCLSSLLSCFPPLLQRGAALTRLQSRSDDGWNGRKCILTTIWGVPKMVVPNNHGVFLLKMIIFGCFGGTTI